jgi:hypothetical protein
MADYCINWSVGQAWDHEEFGALESELSIRWRKSYVRITPSPHTVSKAEAHGTWEVGSYKDNVGSTIFSIADAKNETTGTG